MTLIELTSAYAAIASGHYPIKPRGLPDFGDPVSQSIYGRNLDPDVREAMLDLLWTATNQGTGHAAALPIPTFGKTGTTQNHRDALFVGFAGGLITGVWVGNDDNSPMRGVTGGTLPAQIWHAFMSQADLRAEDLRLPLSLQASLARRIAEMQAAAEQRRLEQLEQMESDDEDGPSLFQWLKPLIPKFLRGDDRDEPRARDGDNRDWNNRGWGSQPDDEWLQQGREDDRPYRDDRDRRRRDNGRIPDDR
jgi:penicillin-binding protein 1A